MIRFLKFAGRWTLRILLVLVVMVVVLFLAKDRIFQSVVRSKLEEQTGLKVELRSAEFDPFSGKVRFLGLKIFNPKEFGNSACLDLEELHLEADRVEFRDRKLLFRLLRIHMVELNIVEDKEGRFNLQAIKEQLDRKKKESKGTGGEDDGAADSPMKFVGIDKLHLTLGRVRKISLNYPDKPVVTELDVRDEVMTDIRTQEDFQTKVLPVLLRGGVAVFYQLWMDSKHRQALPPPASP